MIEHSRANRAYIALNGLAERIHAWLGGAVGTDGSYPAPALAKRAVQAIVEPMFSPFLREYGARAAAGTDLPPGASGKFCCGGYGIDLETGRVAPELRTALRCIAEFAALWLQHLAVFLQWALRRPGGDGPATLVFGVGRDSIWAGGSDARFLDYCRKGPIAPLSQASRLLVQTGPDRPEAGLPDGRHAHYVRFPQQALLLGQRFSARWLAELLYGHCAALLEYLRLMARAPALCALGRDYASHALATSLARRGLIESVVLTVSNYSRQLLWMTDLPGRRFRCHMVWYSMSSNPLTYKADPVFAAFPLYQYIRADDFWLWTPGQAAFLARVGIPGERHTIGPILWYLPGVPPRQDRPEFRVAVFDVLPVSEAWNRTYGLPYNYYETANAIRFIRDITAAAHAAESALGRRVSLVLKHKRPVAAIHDAAYQAALAEAGAPPHGRLESVPPDTDIFSLIASADLVVVIPFSSPAYIASHLGVPSVYHDPTGALAPLYEQAPGIQFSGSDQELARTFQAVLARAIEAA